ncbi:Polyisoprenoid-binding protein YceI [Cribrihabitans marinus]|uniref:Polyisoprenoid-binding protein YceI n=1 Tax=Cribrihabitans marinus TaxID=1227549 RepID=A0A1H6ZRL9_9RHOB|nr:YceI family protein [Cribrihabitans marinus]GGH30715.1 hypothetical protein GCM10010973_21070 [Cribrihabitans marinus]SEJ52352.1 Polyisoprenoid-binding protein YceI [Cribrihabitans marinus]
MTRPSRRMVLHALAGACLAPWLATPSAAARRRYRLDPAASRVGFAFTLSGLRQTGTMPVRRADILVDTDRLERSRVDVTLDAARARTALSFAQTAMLGPGVLEVARFPTIRFVSTSIALGSGGRISDGALIRGDLTLRGITRPVALAAALYRPAGSAPDDLSRLDIRLRGAISRSAFGATAHADLVADTVELDIAAGIRATG